MSIQKLFAISRFPVGIVDWVSLGHLFQIVPFCPPRIAFAFSLGQLCLNVNQQLERRLLEQLYLTRMVFGFSRHHRLQFILAVPSPQCFEAYEPFLPCALDGGVFSTLDLITFATAIR